MDYLLLYWHSKIPQDILSSWWKKYTVMLHIKFVFNLRENSLCLKIEVKKTDSRQNSFYFCSKEESRCRHQTNRMSIENIYYDIVSFLRTAHFHKLAGWKLWMTLCKKTGKEIGTWWFLQFVEDRIWLVCSQSNEESENFSIYASNFNVPKK